MFRWITACACLVCAIACTIACADENLDALVANSEGFLQAHPDMLFRNRGTEAYREQKYEKAMENFRHAARYADKPSQNFVAVMLWNGIGCTPDHAAAYAWMSLAAERGYSDPVKIRDIYWQALTESERQRALDIAKQLQAEYGDAEAKLRLNEEMRYARSHSFAAHPAAKSYQVVVNVKGPDGIYRPVDGSLYNDNRFRDPSEYWRWQDQQAQAALHAHVDVSPPQPVPSDGKP